MPPAPVQQGHRERCPGLQVAPSGTWVRWGTVLSPTFGFRPSSSFGEGPGATPSQRHGSVQPKEAPVSPLHAFSSVPMPGVGAPHLGRSYRR
jgi:hypothetical protein